MVEKDIDLKISQKKYCRLMQEAIDSELCYKNHNGIMMIIPNYTPLHVELKRCPFCNNNKSDWMDIILNKLFSKK